MSDYGQYDGNFPFVDETPPPPPSLATTIGGLLGFGPVLRMMNDPMMQAHMTQMMQTIIESAGANLRIEAKLDYILRKLGHDPAEFAATPGPGNGFGTAAFLARLPNFGTGTAPVAGHVAVDGTGAATLADPSTHPRTRE